MLKVASRDQWLVSLDVRMDLDFAVWVLERDGLPVGPFNEHGEGSGELRAQGLDVDSWEAWVAAMFSSNRFGDFWPPAILWPGSGAIREYLGQLWQSYLPLSNSRRTALQLTIDSKPYQKMASRLWRDLKAYHDRIPSPLTIDFVSYTAETEFLVPPSSAVLTFPSGLPAPSQLHDRIIAVAERLLEMIKDGATPDMPAL